MASNLAPPGPPSVMARGQTAATLTDMGDSSDDENEYSPHRTTVSASAFLARRRARTALSRAANNARLDRLLSRILFARLRSPAFRRLFTTLQHSNRRRRPRGDVWRLRATYGPATQVSETYAIKTVADHRGKTAADHENEEMLQRRVWEQEVIPVPRVLAGVAPVPGQTEPALPTGLNWTVMEDIKGKPYTGLERWSEREKENFCIQLAVIRIYLLKKCSNHIGSWDGVKERAVGVGVQMPGDYCGFHRDELNLCQDRSGDIRDPRKWGEDATVRAMAPPPGGPYPSTCAWLEACLAREAAYWTAYDPTNADADGGESGPTTARTALFLARIGQLRAYFNQRGAAHAAIIQNARDNPDDPSQPYRDAGNYRLSLDFDRGRNLLVRGRRIVAVRDWETAAFLPMSEAMEGINWDTLKANWWARQERRRVITDSANGWYYIFPEQCNLMNGVYQYAEGESDTDREEPGAGYRLFNDSDGGDYCSDTQSKEVNKPKIFRVNNAAATQPDVEGTPEFDWWDCWICPRVSVYVYTWLREMVSGCLDQSAVPAAPEHNLVSFSQQLTARNQLLRYCTNGRMDPRDHAPRIKAREVRMIVVEDADIGVPEPPDGKDLPDSELDIPDPGEEGPDPFDSLEAIRWKMRKERMDRRAKRGVREKGVKGLRVKRMKAKGEGDDGGDGDGGGDGGG